MSARVQTSVTLDCQRVVKRFGDHLALRGVNATLAPSECLALLGPSGCGKSTLLNIITGMLRVDDGRVICGDEVLDDPATRRFVPLRKRRFAMVFQDFSLWPHMTVAANVAFAPRLEGVGSAECGERVAGALARVRMERFADRYPSQLSGGQQQRVAMARAIAAQPRLLLLDEPLSALDAVLREELRDEIARLVHELGTPTVFVTHDQGEALAIADRVAVMRDGEIEQCATASEVYRAPASEFVARFVGAANVIAADDGRPLAVRREDLQFVSPGADAAASSSGGEVRRWRGRVSACIYLGERYEITLDLGAAGTLRGYGAQSVALGAELVAVAPRARLITLPSESPR
ncbi:MAG: ABC transporter ATP-binding protein [Phycisphaeraceae bacterium]|nr:ABC transporter ATP-binding protein [Phycisphaeraceae bacterium]